MEKEGLVMTVGGNLHAKHVIFVKPQSNPSAWQPFILAALRKAADENLKSISFPALGTSTLVSYLLNFTNINLLVHTHLIIQSKQKGCLCL